MCAAEHGINASTFTAHVIASTGADVAACLSGAVGAINGPLHGDAPSRVLYMIERVESTGEATAYVKGVLDRGERLMGFGLRVYRAQDPRARVPKATCERLGAPRFSVAAALEIAALEELQARRLYQSWPRTLSSWRPSCPTSPRCLQQCSADVHLRAHRRTVCAHY